MQTFGDVALVASIIIALIFVPPYLWKQYGGPPIMPAIVRGLRFLWSCLIWRESGSWMDDDGSGTSSGNVVPAQQHQAASELVLINFETVFEYVKKHKLTDEQLIDLLSVLHRESGDLMSANKIRDTVGGNEKEVKARVARHRPKPSQPRTQGRLVRPENGW